MLQRDGLVMVVMKVLVMMRMMMMMIPMKPSSMAVMMVTISPLREGISRQISTCRRAFSISMFSAPQRRRSLSLIPPILGFRG
jgi:hypothetical protein